jgi:hypothetical protein
MKDKLKTVGFAAVVSALAVGGMAIAQDDDGSGSPGKDRIERVHHIAGPPPPGGPGLMGAGRNLTYSETHLREDGEDVTVRTDKGKVTATDEDSIEIERNDGETLDIPVDDTTRVLAGPRKRDADVGDIADGKKVIVVRKSGSDAAELVAVEPKRGIVRMRLRGAPRPGDGPMEFPVPPPLEGGR